MMKDYHDIVCDFVINEANRNRLNDEMTKTSKRVGYSTGICDYVFDDGRYIRLSLYTYLEEDYDGLYRLNTASKFELHERTGEIVGIADNLGMCEAGKTCTIVDRFGNIYQIVVSDNPKDDKEKEPEENPLI